MIPEGKTRVQITITKEDLTAAQEISELWGMTVSQYFAALARADRERGVTAMMLDFVSNGNSEA